jgi:hypothetical protein
VERLDLGVVRLALIGPQAVKLLLRFAADALQLGLGRVRCLGLAASLVELLLRMCQLRLQAHEPLTLSFQLGVLLLSLLDRRLLLADFVLPQIKLAL